MDDYLKFTNEYFCLTTDGWSNIKGDPVINYMAISPQKTLLLERVNTGEQSHTGRFIAEDIVRVMYPLKDKVSFFNNFIIRYAGWLLTIQAQTKRHGLHWKMSSQRNFFMVV